MEIKQVSIDRVIPYSNNPRINDDAAEKVANSIKEFGWQQPIVVDKNYVIIAGHTRLKAAKILKLKTVPVVVAENLTEEQVKAYRLADNKTGELADWDMDLLKIEMDDLMDFDMEQFGFEFEDADDFGDPEEAEIDAEADANEDPKAKQGDIYQLGRHRLMCGDSTQEKDVQRLMGGLQADMLLTDPPYGVSYVGHTEDKLTIQNDSLDDDDFIDFLSAAFCGANNIMKPGAVFYIWHASSRILPFLTACETAGWKIRQHLIWVKNSLCLGRQDYQWKHEPCLYGWKSGAPHKWKSDRSQTTILEFDKPLSSAEHPTMKPVKLFDYLMRNNTDEEDIVLDLFGGSGTTIIAAEQNGRTGYVMEYDPKYVDVIINRWEKLTGKKAEKIKDV